jgi:hypothetical protein
MGYLLMVFLSMLVARSLRGCLKWIVLAGLVAVVCNRDPVLASKLWDLLSEAAAKLREFVMEL